MRILFLNIASHDGLLALCTEEKIIASKTIDHRIGDHELIPLIEEALKETKWDYKNLTHIACVIGPGGFTSLRIAVACANTLADQLQIPSAGMHLSDLFAARLPPAGETRGSPLRGGNIFWIHSTKKHELFIRSLANSDQWPKPTHITLDEALEKIPEGSHWCGELLPEHEEAFKNLNLKSTTYNLQPTTSVIPEFLTDCTYEKELLKPWYGRGW